MSYLDKKLQIVYDLLNKLSYELSLVDDLDTKKETIRLFIVKNEEDLKPFIIVALKNVFTKKYNFKKHFQNHVQSTKRSQIYRDFFQKLNKGIIIDNKNLKIKEEKSDE